MRLAQIPALATLALVALVGVIVCTVLHVHSGILDQLAVILGSAAAGQAMPAPAHVTTTPAGAA